MGCVSRGVHGVKGEPSLRAVARFVLYYGLRIGREESCTDGLGREGGCSISSALALYDVFMINDAKDSNLQDIACIYSAFIASPEH